MRRTACLAGLAALVGCFAENSAFNPTSAGSGDGTQSGSAGLSSGSAGTVTTTGASAITSDSASDPTSTSSASSDSTGGQSGETEVVEATTSGGQVQQAFQFTDDEWEGEFGAGNAMGIEWVGGGIGLQPQPSMGSLVSRVFDGGPDATWTRLRWSPRAPYGKPLPNGGASELGYVEGGADMDGIVLLLHLDGEMLGPGDTVRDDSGLGNHGVIEFTGADVVPGKFGRALGKGDPNGFVELDEQALAPGTEDFTWSVWYRQNECNGATILALDDPGNEAGTSSVWISCAATCPGVDPVFPVARMRISHGSPIDLCGASDIGDGRWHHLVLRSVGHPNIDAAVFVDGDLEDEASGTIGPVLSAADGEEMTLGGSNDESWQGVGEFDEVAIWHRGLSDVEIESLYLRGAHRLGLQVRVCDEGRCDDASTFIGPDGTDLTRFVDADGPMVEHTFPGGARGRYLQYEAFLDSDDEGKSPVLQSVTVAGNHE